MRSAKIKWRNRNAIAISIKRLNRRINGKQNIRMYFYFVFVFSFGYLILVQFMTPLDSFIRWKYFREENARVKMQNKNIKSIKIKTLPNVYNYPFESTNIEKVNWCDRKRCKIWWKWMWCFGRCANLDASCQKLQQNSNGRKRITRNRYRIRNQDHCDERRVRQFCHFFFFFAFRFSSWLHRHTKVS